MFDLAITLLDVYEYLIMAIKLEKLWQWKSFNNFSKLFGICVVRFLLFPIPVFSPVEMNVLGARIKNVFLVMIKRFLFSLSLSCIFVCSAVAFPCVLIEGIAQVPVHMVVGLLPPLPVVDKLYYLRGWSCLCMQEIYVGFAFHILKCAY